MTTPPGDTWRAGDATSEGGAGWAALVDGKEVAGAGAWEGVGAGVGEVAGGVGVTAPVGFVSSSVSAGPKWPSKKSVLSSDMLCEQTHGTGIQGGRGWGRWDASNYFAVVGGHQRKGSCAFYLCAILGGKVSLLKNSLNNRYSRTSATCASISQYCNPFRIKFTRAPAGTSEALILDRAIWLSLPKVNAECKKPFSKKMFELVRHNEMPTRFLQIPVNEEIKLIRRHGHRRGFERA